MTQHPSLKGGEEGKKFRSVLKRYEKIKELAEKDKWEEEKNSVYNLPKVKRIKFKVKKTKAVSEETEAAEVEGGVAAAPAAGAETKEKAKEGPKGETKKGEAKK